MLIPRMFLGTGLVVRKRVTALLKKAAGASPSDVEFGPMVKVGDAAEALIVLDQSDRNLQGEHFHSYLLLEEVMKAKDRDCGDTWFDWSISSAWGLSGLMASSAKLYFLAADVQSDEVRAARRLPYLRAVRTHLDELESIGPRYLYMGEQDVLSRLGAIRPYTMLKLAGVRVGAPGSSALKAALDSYLSANPAN